MQGTPHFTVETYIHEQSPAKETQSLVNIHQRYHLKRLSYTKNYLEKRPIKETCKRDPITRQHTSEIPSEETIIHEKIPGKETYKRDLQKRPNHSSTYIRDAI